MHAANLVKRSLVGLLLVSLLLTGCGEEARTRIILRGFDNSASLFTVYVTASPEFFTPGWPTSVSHPTAEIPPGSVRDVVVLDLPQSQALDQYYLYLFADSDASGGVNDGDEFFPIIAIRPEPGQTVELHKLINTIEVTDGLSTNSLTVFNLAYNLPYLPGPNRPLRVELRLGAGPTDYTAGVPRVSMVITDPAAVSTLSLFMGTNAYTYLAYLDLDNSGTPSAGDLATEADASAVTSGFIAVNGVLEIDIALNGFVL